MKFLSAVTPALAVAAMAFTSAPAYSAETIKRAGERPRLAPAACTADHRYFGSFQGIGQIGIYLDKAIYEGGCFMTKRDCESWLYNIRSDHGAGERSASCRARG